MDNSGDDLLDLPPDIPDPKVRESLRRLAAILDERLAAARIDRMRSLLNMEA